MRDLTKAEEQIMRVLWRLERAFVKDIVARFPDPKPAYNTVLTVLRVLERKGVVAHRAYGRSHEFHPLVSRDEYRRVSLRALVKDYFDDSLRDVVSQFAGDRRLDLRELEEIRTLLARKIAERRGAGR